MLILSRKINESIIIDGKIKVRIIKIDGDTIKLGIEAPSDTPVHRQEVYDEIQKNNREALTTGRPVLPRLGNKSATSSPDKKAEPQQILTK